MKSSEKDFLLLCIPIVLVHVLLQSVTIGLLGQVMLDQK